MYISDKFQPRSIVAIHMGYSEQTKGYVLYDLKDKHFFISRDVIFKEFIFPFFLPSSTTWKLFPTTTSSTDADPCTSSDLSSPSPVPLVPAHTSEPPIQRKSQRTTTTPLWMKDYVTHVQNAPSTSKPLYSIDQYLGYD